jgi:hypothetical protein
MQSRSSRLHPHDPHGLQTGAVGYAVELLFDPTTEAALKGLWARLGTAGVPSLASRTHRRHRPHISLSVAERIDAAQLRGARDFLATTHLDVTLDALRSSIALACSTSASSRR